MVSYDPDIDEDELGHIYSAGNFRIGSIKPHATSFKLTLRF
jgi:hypothetical protein